MRAGAVSGSPAARQLTKLQTEQRGALTQPLRTARRRVFEFYGLPDLQHSMHCSLLSLVITATAALQPTKKMWGTAAWNWGSAVGDAHDAAAELRSALSTEDARRDYLIALRNGRISEASAKLCFALTCQRSGGALPSPFNDAYSALVRGEYENDAGFADLATTAAPGIDRYNLNVQLSVKPQRLTEFLEIIEANAEVRSASRGTCATPGASRRRRRACTTSRSRSSASRASTSIARRRPSRPGRVSRGQIRLRPNRRCSSTCRRRASQQTTRRASASPRSWQRWTSCRAGAESSNDGVPAAATPSTRK